MRLAAPVAIALAAVTAFTLEGLAFASWAVERSPACRSDPSFECAGGGVFAALVAVVVGVVGGIASGFAARHYFVGRRRAAVATSAAVLALVAGAHWLQLH